MKPTENIEKPLRQIPEVPEWAHRMADLFSSEVCSYESSVKTINELALKINSLTRIRE